MTSRRLAPRQRLGEGIVWCEGRRHALARRLGYRGLTLTTFGLIFVLIGLSVLGLDDYSTDLPHTHLPDWFRVCLWGIPGLVAIGTAWDGRAQVWGFTLMFIPPAERAVSFTIGVFSDTGGIHRLPGALIYVMITLTLMLFAAWPDPPEVSEGAPVQRPTRRRSLTEQERPDRSKGATT